MQRLSPHTRSEGLASARIWSPVKALESRVLLEISASVGDTDIEAFITPAGVVEITNTTAKLLLKLRVKGTQ